jgi:hypothetical protein
MYDSLAKPEIDNRATDVRANLCNVTLVTDI